MDIAFGASVFGVAGKRLGDVDGIVVSAGTQRVRAIIVDGGFLNQTRHMVEISAIQSSDERGLHLDSTKGRAEAESQVIDSEQVALPERTEPPEIFMGAAGAGGPVIMTDPVVPGRYPENTSFFDLAPVDPPPVEVESNLLVNEVIISRKTRATSSDGHTLGDVVALETGDMGVVVSFTVSEGFVFKEQSRFLQTDIDEFGTDAVHLNITADEAKTR